MKHCPRCNITYTGYSALSRLDNQTEICTSCGAQEAIAAWSTRDRRAGEAE